MTNFTMDNHDRCGSKKQTTNAAHLLVSVTFSGVLELLVRLQIVLWTLNTHDEGSVKFEHETSVAMVALGQAPHSDDVILYCTDVHLEGDIESHENVMVS